MKDIAFFAVKEFAEAATDVDRHVEQLYLNGYTVLNDVLDERALQLARRKIDRIYKQQVDELGGDEHLLEIIKDSNFARCLLAYDDFFLTEVAANKRVIEIIEKALGDQYILMLQNGVINKPFNGKNSNACAFHRDLNYQHFTSSRPLSLTALFCIDHFTEKTGATCVLPYTHKIEKCPSSHYVENNEKAVIAKAGSVIIFDSMMYHRAGRNTTEYVRRAVVNMYVLPFIKQQISFPQILKGAYSEDPFYKKLLGYNSEPEKDVITFRKKRIMRFP